MTPPTPAPSTGHGANALVWFRRDLRTTDHTALHEASLFAQSAGGFVIGVFVACPEEWRAHDDAPVKIDFWRRNLVELSRDLAKLNIPLLLVVAKKRAEIAPALLSLARAQGVSRLHLNAEYEVNEQRRDEVVARHLSAAGVTVRAHHDHVVFDPASIRTGSGGFYSVFTPFKKAWLRRAEEDPVRALPAPKKQAQTGVASSPIPDVFEGFESRIDPAHWPAGERFAQKHLAEFCSRRIAAYKDQRDFPSVDGTSRLSPYLNSGVLSPRQCVLAAQEANSARLDDRAPGRPGPAHWISEVVWREFYQHVLVGFPRVSMHRAFRPATERINWAKSDDHFKAWCEGRTGVPIVDAGMRQLAALGWMHNRLRMIVAMYLTKDLFIDWRRGERYFMQNLVDGDLGSNNGGWQWSASTGTDAAPYFRIYNPVLQSQRFDEQGQFIRTWVPELKGIEGDAVHDPALLPGLLRTKLDYPEPLVDRAATKDRVMAAFKGLDDRIA